MKHYQNPFLTLTKFEWSLWISSLICIVISFLIVSDKMPLTLVASLIGVTALIFLAKGDPLGQALTVVFAVFYSIISVRFRYYGEMITYLGMTAPIALLSTISWLKNPYKDGENEVKVTTMTWKKWTILVGMALAVTGVFYFILRYFNTTNLWISTLSVTTSFIASGLTYLRSPFYGVGYGANDVVLITMWIMATIHNPSYLPVVICFVIFLVNDCYGFVNWRRISKRQNGD